MTLQRRGCRCNIGGGGGEATIHGEERLKCSLGQRRNSFGEEGSSSGQKPRVLCLELDFSAGWVLMQQLAGCLAGELQHCLGLSRSQPVGQGRPPLPRKEASSILGLWAVWKLLQ